ncbi:MAG: sigma-70 family RNA polymerase sigma factor [Proteobacteria bacterium]|nr:sigma-70 family RNA polymerase sigma factor [Pseudomonadota bacterium]
MVESLDTWFKREVLAHEASLLRYLLRVWPRKHEIDDLRQEAYARVYQAARTVRPTSPRAFLLSTAHHLITDRVRRERIVSIEAVGDLEALDVSVDEISAEQRVSARQELKRLAAALDRLPPRCRMVIWLRRVEGLSQKEVAEQMGVSVKAVEQQVSKGGRLLAKYMLDEDIQRGREQQVSIEHEDDCEHGQP